MPIQREGHYCRMHSISVTFGIEYRIFANKYCNYDNKIGKKAVIWKAL